MNTTTQTPQERLTEILKQRDKKNQIKLASYKPLHVAFKHIENGEVARVIEYISEYNPRDHSKILLYILETAENKEDAYDMVAKKIMIYEFQYLSIELALNLLHHRKYAVTGKKLDSFEQLNYEVSELLIKHDKTSAFMVARKGYKFRSEDHKKIACLLIQEGYEDIFTPAIPTFNMEVLMS